MPRSRKRKSTGETTRLFHPSRQQKIKRRRFWPYFFLIILLGVAGYYFWDEFIQPPQMPLELTRRSEKRSQAKTSADKKNSLSEKKTPDAKQNSENQAPKTRQESTGKISSPPETEKIEKGANVSSQLQQNIQVEILNGCGKQGMAAKFAKILRNHGIDVVKTGNYKSLDVKNTQIMDRIGNRSFALRVGEILGVHSKFIYTQKRKELLIDATVIIGKDYAKLIKK